jgi:hypothetical protein
MNKMEWIFPWTEVRSPETEVGSNYNLSPINDKMFVASFPSYIRHSTFEF